MTAYGPPMQGRRRVRHRQRHHLAQKAERQVAVHHATGAVEERDTPGGAWDRSCEAIARVSADVLQKIDQEMNRAFAKNVAKNRAIQAEKKPARKKLGS